MCAVDLIRLFCWLQEFALLQAMGARYVAPTMLEEYGDAAWEVLQDRWRLW